MDKTLIITYLRGLIDALGLTEEDLFSTPNQVNIENEDDDTLLLSNPTSKLPLRHPMTKRPVSSKQAVPSTAAEPKTEGSIIESLKQVRSWETGARISQVMKDGETIGFHSLDEQPDVVNPVDMSFNPADVDDDFGGLN